MSFSPTLVLSFLSVLFSFCYASTQDRTSINSPYATSQHSIKLTIVPGVTSGSSEAQHQSNARSVSAVNNTEPLIKLELSFAATIQISDQYFSLIVDTGSSDIWVPDSFYTCLYGSIGPYSSPVSQNYCAFGPTFNRNDINASFNVTAGSNFYTTYSDGTSAAGSLGQVTLGLTSDLIIPNQQIGLATLSSWSGDNVTSGVLGLAFSSLTSKYPGTNIWDDVPCSLTNHSSSAFSANHTCNQENYPSLIETLFQASENSSSGFNDNIFSLALSRDESGNSSGGSLTFGGVPDMSSASVNVSCSFVTIPIEPLSIDPSQELTFYAISLDGFMLPPTGGHLSNYSIGTSPTSSRVRRREYLDQAKSRRSTENVMYPASTDVQISQYIVDSGTTLTFLPAPVSTAFNTLFQPPAYRDYSGAGGLWRLSCDNITFVPDFGVSIAGQVFYHNHADLVHRVQTYEYNRQTGQYEETVVCVSAIQDYYQPKAGIAGILGQPFLKNVLAVFDVGRSEMGFAERMYYES